MSREADRQMDAGATGNAETGLGKVPILRIPEMEQEACRLSCGAIWLAALVNAEASLWVSSPGHMRALWEFEVRGGMHAFTGELSTSVLLG